MPRLAKMNAARRCAQLLRHERELGNTFEDAWERCTHLALAAYRGERQREQREEWRQALEWSRDAFERVYGNQPRRKVDWLELLPEAQRLPAQERLVVLR